MCSSWHMTPHSCPLCPVVCSRAYDTTSLAHSLPKILLEVAITLQPLQPTDSLP